MRSSRIFGAYLALAAAGVLFVLLTVNRRPASDFEHNLFAQRVHWVVTFWQTHGYFASAGMIALPPIAAGRPISTPYYFYRSSTGAWFLPSLIVENAAHIVKGRYDPRWAAWVNMLIAGFTAALLALLGYRIAMRLGISPWHAFSVGAAVLAVHFTFPDVLSAYWEISTEQLAMPFWIAFLLLRDGCIADERRRRIAQAIVVFAGVYCDPPVAVLFFASYFAVCFILRRESIAVRDWLTTILAPAAAALFVFALQLTIAHVRHPEIPLIGSSFLVRSGLDGDTSNYVDHLDILHGRDRVRGVFPQSRAPLFRWPALFVTGMISLAALLFLYIRRRLPDGAFVAIATLVGTYALYAGIFSQSTAIHPYNFDYLLVTPLLLAVFGCIPAIAEAVTEDSGAFVLLTLFAAVWYAMVQLRDYALRYPLV